MKKTQKDSLIKASEQVLKLAASRRARMAARKASASTKVAAAEELPDFIKEKKEEAEEKKDDEKKDDDKEVKAAAVKAAEQLATGEAALTPAPKADANVGKEDFGLHVPPELAQVVEDGKAEEDENMTPGLLIPPGLEDSVMAVCDTATLGTDGEPVQFEAIPFVSADARTVGDILAAGAHWVLLANGKPLAEVSLADQDYKEKIAAHFVSADFARSLVEGIGTHGLVAALAAVKAKPYVAVVDTNAKIVEIKAKLAASAEEALRQKTAALKAKYVENLSLVLRASAQNFIVQNPLKDSLTASLRDLGLPEQTAADMIDNAFFQHGEKTIASILDKAEEWSNTPVEAMNAIKAAMDQAGRRSRPLPSQMSPAALNPNYDHDLARRMQAAAVPVNPASSESTVSASMRVTTPAQPAETVDDRSSFRARYGKFGR